MTAHMAAMFVLGKVIKRLKENIKDEKTLKEVKRVVTEEFTEVFNDFMATASVY